MAGLPTTEMKPGGGYVMCLHDQIKHLEAEVAELRKDAERYHFILPIITGNDSDNADKIAMAVAIQLMKGLDGDAAIDAAMKEAE
jgi:hypothetical protein